MRPSKKVIFQNKHENILIREGSGREHFSKVNNFIQYNGLRKDRNIPRTFLT